jgi:hypothetical protein
MVLLVDASGQLAVEIVRRAEAVARIGEGL